MPCIRTNIEVLSNSIGHIMMKWISLKNLKQQNNFILETFVSYYALK